MIQDAFSRLIVPQKRKSTQIRLLKGYPFITLLLIFRLYYLKTNQGRDINKSVIKGYVLRWFFIPFLQAKKSDCHRLKTRFVSD